MNRKPTHYWHERLVMSHLIHASSIHRRLPAVKVQGYVSLWPETLRDDWHRLYDALNSKNTLGFPMPPEVTYHEEVMEWLRRLDKLHQQILWMRASRIPWKILTEELGMCKGALWGRMNAGLYQIALHLNRTDPLGEYFRRLEYRANGFGEHS